MSTPSSDAGAAPNTARVKAYFDYICPFSWRGAELAEMVAEPLGLEFDWHPYSLYQGNYQGENGWRLWHDPLPADAQDGGKGLLPFLASNAAREQGEALYNRFRLALARAYHRGGRPYSKRTCFEVAGEVGLDMTAFARDLISPAQRERLAKDHEEAAAAKVSGTPTFHFGSGQVAYLRLSALPQTPEEAVGLFRGYKDVLEHYPYLQAIRRPY